MLRPDNEERVVEVNDPQVNTIIISQTPNDIINRFDTSLTELIQKCSGSTDQFVLKSCIILSVSALDFYIHEIVKHMILVIFDGRAAKTPSYKKFIVSLECVEKAIRNPELLDWLDEEVYHRNSYKSFQRADKISEAMKLIYPDKIWDKLAPILSMEKKAIKDKLDDIVVIRDDLSHQDCSTTNTLISSDTLSNIQFIQNIVEGIHQLVIT